MAGRNVRSGLVTGVFQPQVDTGNVQTADHSSLAPERRQMDRGVSLAIRHGEIHADAVEKVNQRRVASGGGQTRQGVAVFVRPSAQPQLLRFFSTLRLYGFDGLLRPHDITPPDGVEQCFLRHFSSLIPLSTLRCVDHATG